MVNDKMVNNVPFQRAAFQRGIQMTDINFGNYHTIFATMISHLRKNCFKECFKPSLTSHRVSFISDLRLCIVEY